MFGYFFHGALGDFQCLQSRLKIFARMSFKKFAALSSQVLHDFLPLFSLAVCFGIWLALNLAA
jgi:hypothetical protein